MICEKSKIFNELFTTVFSYLFIGCILYNVNYHIDVYLLGIFKIKENSRDTCKKTKNIYFCSKMLFDKSNSKVLIELYSLNKR